MAKKIEFTLKNLLVEFHCSKCNKDQRVEINEDCLDSWDYGSIFINVECPGCGIEKTLDIGNCL
jgi:uncharacterized Fe-S cluster-containing protein